MEFDSCKKFVNSYEGADTKFKIKLDGEYYMLKIGRKLESQDRKPLQASYSASSISEYLGSNIYKLAGIPVQETVLGTYQNHIAVACKDFVLNRDDSDDVQLIEFKKLETSYLESSTAGGRTPDYNNLMEIFANHSDLAPLREAALERYWQMFAVDSLIGNFDRHAGNWGYIYSNSQERLIELSPVYDCGSSFYPQLNEHGMEDFLNDREALVQRVKTFPAAALMINGKKVKYHEFLLSDAGEACRKVLPVIYSRLDDKKLNDLIDSVPEISNVRKDFYKVLVSVRKNEILKPAYEMAMTKGKPGLETCKMRAERNSILLNAHPVVEEKDLQNER